MSKIAELIQELCPEGVPARPLEQLVNIRNGRDYKHLSAGDVPVYGSGGVMTYVAEAAYGSPSVLIPRKGSLGNLFYVDSPFWTVDTIFYTEIGPDLLEKYLFYYLKTMDLAAMNLAGGVPSLTQSMLGKIRVPVPPREVQKEIVSILDKFTQLEAELEAELEARRTQYEVTRDRLLDFTSDLELHPLGTMIRELCPEGVENKTLSSLLGTIPRGKRLTKSALPEGGLIPVFHGGLEPIGFTDQANTAAMTVMVINVGASAGTVGWSEKPFWCSDGCFAMPHSDLILPKYLYYCALSNQGLLVERVRKAGIPTLAADSVLALEIPVPPLKIQEEIVSILDKLDALCNDITLGLPAEIAARRKQYEYYRYKLLTFKELDAA